MDPFTLSLIIGGIAEGFGLVTKSMANVAASKARIRSLEMQSKESTIRHQQETINNYDILEKTIKAQEAEASTRGIAFSSPSLEAIETESVNESAKAQKNLDLEESIYQQNLKIEKKAVKNTLFTTLFGDISNAAFDFAKYSASVPK